jgi:multiple sugar transport system substrate-binding protein
VKRAISIVIAIVALGAAGCGGGSSGSSGGQSGTAGAHGTVVLWHGYTMVEAKEMKALAAEFNRTHPGITVKPEYYGNSDYALQKVLTAIAGGDYPDIAYLYGSWAPNIAKSSKVVDLTDMVKSTKGFDWNDFFPSTRLAATVNGKVVGVPALVDNLALVYNKRLFQQAGLSLPTANWTWSDFEHAALKLTDPAKKQFGWAYVADGSEDTVWRFEAMLWQAGGAILNSDNTKAAFDSPAGVRALSLIGRLAQRHAIYLDNGSDNYINLFDSGHIGMLWTGPWDLPQIRQSKVPYGVQILPRDLNHQTISGPDNWVLFDNGEARRKAAFEFMNWFTAPKQDLQWALATGDLPIRRSVTKLPGYQEFLAKYPGVGTWVANLANAKQARPQLTEYPRISQAMGQAVVSVLLGKAQPQPALSAAAQKANSVLVAP